MAKAKKVSFNQATAKNTAGHNDRSMYPWGYEERSNNKHWDMYRCGSSVEAEARFYEDTFTPTLEAQNAKALAMRKYDRVMDMKTWHKKHPLKECIVQLGDVENNDTSREFAEGVAQMMMDAIRAAGGTPVSVDLHDDERTIDEDGNEIKGTAHLQIRYAFVGENKDKNPVIDMKNVLLAHGVQPPNPDKPISKNNNPAQTFLETTRTMLEDYADELELKHGNPRVDRDRTKRAHSSVQEYKTRKRLEGLWKRVEELEKQANEAEVKRDAAIAKAAETQQKAESRALAVSRREETVRNDENRLNRRSRALDVRDRKQDERADALDRQEADVKNNIGFLAMLKQQVLDLLAMLKGEIDKQLLEEMKQKAEEIEKATASVVVYEDDSEDITTDMTDDYSGIDL